MLDRLAEPKVIVALIILIFFIGFRLRRMRKYQTLRIKRLWIIPLLLTTIMLISFYRLPPNSTQWMWAVLAIAVGGMIGWYRGKLMEIKVDPTSNVLIHRASPAAIIFIIVIILGRLSLRFYGASNGLDLTSLTDALIAFSVGFFSATRMEMYIRGQKILVKS